MSHRGKTGEKPFRGARFTARAKGVRPTGVRAGLSRLERVAHLWGMTTNTVPRGGLEPLMSIDALSELLGVPIKTIKDWRTKGEGPVAYKIGNHVRYARSDVHAWLEQCREPSVGIAPGYGKR